MLATLHNTLRDVTMPFIVMNYHLSYYFFLSDEMKHSDHVTCETPPAQ